MEPFPPLSIYNNVMSILKTLFALDVLKLPTAGGFNQIELCGIIRKWRKDEHETQLLVKPGDIGPSGSQCNILDTNQSKFSALVALDVGSTLNTGAIIGIRAFRLHFQTRLLVRTGYAYYLSTRFFLIHIHGVLAHIAVARIVWQDGLGIVQHAGTIVLATCLHIKAIDLSGNLALVSITILTVQLGGLLIFLKSVLPILILLEVLGFGYGVLERLFILRFLLSLDLHRLFTLCRFDTLIKHAQHAADGRAGMDSVPLCLYRHHRRQAHYE